MLYAIALVVATAPTLATLPEPSQRGSDSALEACLSEANYNDFAMKDCYSSFADREDARLNRNWNRLMAVIDGDKRDAIIAEQRAWLRFRDVSYIHYALGDGTLDRLMGVMCLANLISDRADQLDGLTHYYNYE